MLLRDAHRYRPTRDKAKAYRHLIKLERHSTEEETRIETCSCCEGDTYKAAVWLFGGASIRMPLCLMHLKANRKRGYSSFSAFNEVLDEVAPIPRRDKTTPQI